MLQAERLTKRFPGAPAPAVQDVSIELKPGMRLGVTGPSGCGKSTLAGMLALLIPADAGRITIDGQEAKRFGFKAPPHLRRSVQLLWQSPAEATDPRMRLREMIGESVATVKGDPAEAVPRLSDLVGLSHELLERFPHEVSGGQLQRACLARALGTQPKYLLADEATSMLDTSSQANLLHTLAGIQQSEGVGILLITHDHTLAEHWCDEVQPFSDLQATVAS